MIRLNERVNALRFLAATGETHPFGKEFYQSFHICCVHSECVAGKRLHRSNRDLA